MTKYYPYKSFTNVQLTLLKVTTLYFGNLVILDPIGASTYTIGADHVVRNAVRLLDDAGILQMVAPTDVLAQDEQGTGHNYGTQTLCQLDRRFWQSDRLAESHRQPPQHGEGEIPANAERDLSPDVKRFKHGRYPAWRHPSN